MSGLIWRLLHYKPGAASYIVGGLLLAVSMALFTQYKMKGRVDVVSLIDRDADRKPFWDRNPRFEYVDSFPRTSFLIVKDRQTGRTAMVDAVVVINTELRPAACDSKVAFKLLPGATDIVCFEIIKPDTGVGIAYVGAVSFQAKAKDSQVAQFYRDLFLKHGNKVSPIKNSSWGVILEAEDKTGETVARISTRSPFDTAQAFFAWTKDFE